MHLGYGSRLACRRQTSTALSRVSPPAGRRPVVGTRGLLRIAAKDPAPRIHTLETLARDGVSCYCCSAVCRLSTASHAVFSYFSQDAHALALAKTDLIDRPAAAKALEGFQHVYNITLEQCRDLADRQVPERVFPRHDL